MNHCYIIGGTLISIIDIMHDVNVKIKVEININRDMMWHNIEKIALQSNLKNIEVYLSLDIYSKNCIPLIKLDRLVQKVYINLGIAIKFGLIYAARL